MNEKDLNNLAREQSLPKQQDSSSNDLPHFAQNGFSALDSATLQDSHLHAVSGDLLTGGATSQNQNNPESTRPQSLFKTIKEDFAIILQKDPAISSKIELFFNYPGLIALVHYRLAHKIYNAGFKVLARIMMGLSGFITNVDIHPAAKIGRRVFIDHAIGVVIGETAEVGNDVMIYQGVTLGGTSLDKVKRHPTIEDGVVIGAGAKILGNIRIGSNAKIGANSVVIKDVPSDCTAVGIPARVIVKGRAKEASAINKLPDIDKAMFEYLLKRMQILESALDCGDYAGVDSKLAQEKRQEREQLEQIYAAFLRSLRG